MKTKSKALLLALCAVSLVTASVLGTMAYLTDKKAVTNNFTVGSVAITLDEAKVNPDGSPAANAERVQSNNYKLLPGQEYKKDPTIHVDPSSEECYLFVKVENGIVDIEKEGSTTVANQMAKKGWKLVTGNVYVYADNNGKPAVVAKGANIPVFDNITIDGSVTGDELKDYANETITVTAYAVQKAGFEQKSAAEIWTAAGFN